MTERGTSGGMEITSTDLLDARTVERFFCLALLQDGPEITQRVLARFIDYRERKDEILAYLDGDASNAPANVPEERT